MDRARVHEERAAERVSRQGRAHDGVCGSAQGLPLEQAEGGAVPRGLLHRRVHGHRGVRDSRAGVPVVGDGGGLEGGTLASANDPRHARLSLQVRPHIVRGYRGERTVGDGARDRVHPVPGEQVRRHQRDARAVPPRTLVRRLGDAMAPAAVPRLLRRHVEFGARPCGLLQVPGRQHLRGRQHVLGPQRVPVPDESQPRPGDVHQPRREPARARVCARQRRPVGRLRTSHRLCVC